MKLFNTLLAGVCLLGLGACQAESNPANAEKTTAKETVKMAENITELQKIDTQVGTGREAEPGFNVTVHYTGWLYDPAAKDGKGKKIRQQSGSRSAIQFLPRRWPGDSGLG
jgi:FKBP-type peptidyl-prolyl cis-trans isomerase FkpA